MSLSTLRNALGDYAKDTKLNLGKVFEEDGAPGLSQTQVYAIALASAYASKHADVVHAITAETAALPAAHIEAAKAAATIMGMNNVYYRFLHLVSDKEYSKMPANLRMNIIGNPGIDKVDFELMSLAVSAINGCGMCMDAHVHEVVKGGVSKQGVQSAIRIAAVIMAAAQALTIDALAPATSAQAA